jgi:2,3-bisphosphoglycerate-dependent phosphoglycerate mutase
MNWRRKYDGLPPALREEDAFQRAISTDERYRDDKVPSTESLQLTEVRVREVWEDTIAPALLEGKNVMVVSHGNTLRAMVKLLDRVDDADSFYLDLPTACPVIYEFDADLEPLDVHGFWGSSEVARRGRFLMDSRLVAQAQTAMRQQCLQNIAVTTVSREGQDSIKICDAWTSEKASDGLALDADGRSYNVRERPPSYFALESERIKSAARKELRGMMTGIDSMVNTGGVAAEPPPVATAIPHVSLIILRHGYSEYNAENRFTGWADVELSNIGREEARFAGSLLREAGCVRLEGVFTSYLKRAIKTAWLMLDELEMQWVPVHCEWRLNERHYGLLQGKPKRECSVKYGVKQVQKWRRGIHHEPPPWKPEQVASTVDRRYDDVPVPSTESLADCTKRLRPFLNQTLWPAMSAAVAQSEQEERERLATDKAKRGPARGVPAFAITSSENLIRALVTEIEGVPPEQVPLLDIPYATPLVYHFDEQLQPIPNPLAVAPLKYGYYLGDAQRIREVQQEIRGAVLEVTEDEACQVEEEEECEESCFVLEDALDVGTAVWACEEAAQEQDGEEVTSPQQRGEQVESKGKQDAAR